MAQRFGYSQQPYNNASPKPISAAHTNNILNNYHQDEVVHALMTQLREKDAQISTLSNQRVLLVQEKQTAGQTVRQYQSKVDSQNKMLAERDTKIAVLQNKLQGSGLAIAEANLDHLTEKNAEYKCVLQERDDELTHLRPLLNQLQAKIEEYAEKESLSHSQQLENELIKVRSELEVAIELTNIANTTIEEQEKKIKSKEWMIKSLQEAAADQRSRENKLQVHADKLDETVHEYNTKFEGKGVDVPMLLAKLKDYEVRTKDLQGQIRRLTNKKLNELVIHSSSKSEVDNEEENDNPAKDLSNDSHTSETSSFRHDDDDTLDDSVENEDEDDEDDDNIHPLFSNKSAQDDDMQDEDVLSDFLSDVQVGIETLEMQSWTACCVTERSSPLNLDGSRQSGRVQVLPIPKNNKEEGYDPTSTYSSRTM